MPQGKDLTPVTALTSDDLLIVWNNPGGAGDAAVITAANAKTSLTTDLSTPANSGDAATKGYVDSFLPRVLYLGQGTDAPQASLMVANSSVVRARAAQFDGAIVRIPSAISATLAPSALSQATINSDLTGWSAADFGTHTHNFAFVIWDGNNYGPNGTAIDWTNNTHWATIATNWANLATCLRAAGKFKGIFFDNEAYAGATAWTQNTYPWNWGGDSNAPSDNAANGLGILPATTKSAARALVQSRGKQIMDAVLTAWPECQVICAHVAASSDYQGGQDLAALLDNGWNNIWFVRELLGSFTYGLVQSVVASNTGAVWDGGQNYEMRTQQDYFDFAYYRKYEFPRTSGQLVYVDPLANHRLHVAQMNYDLDSLNGYVVQSPNAVNRQLLYAIRSNDGYSILYTENNDWYGAASSGGKTAISQTYLDAVASAKAGVITPTILTGAATWNPASLTNGSSASTTVTVPDAAIGDPVTGMGLTTITAAGWAWRGNVTAANTVSVDLTNNTGGTVDLASGTLTVFVSKA